MDNKEIISKLEEEVLELDEGTLELGTELLSLEEWDSLSKLSLMAWARKECDITLTAQQIKEFVTVEDICKALM